MTRGLSFDAAARHLTGTEAEFATTTQAIRGVETTVFANAPANLRALQQHGRAVRALEPFVVFEGARLDYADWCAETNRLSARLTAMGVVKGDRVALAMKNRVEFLSLYMAIANIGAVVVALNGWWMGEELEYGFSDSGARLAFADADRARRIAPFADRLGITLIDIDEPGALDGSMPDDPAPDAPLSTDWPEVPIDPEDDFAVMYSSGSTGKPKGVVLTHRSAISAVWSWRMLARMPALMAPADIDLPEPAPPVLMCATPLFHVTASHALFLLSVTMGAKLVLMSKWNPEEALRLMVEEEVTRFTGVPTMAADLRQTAAATGVTPPKLENLGAGGAKRPAAQVAEQQKAFPGAAIASGWGMTETNALGLNIAGPDYVARPGYAGRVAPPVQELRIVDDAGAPLPNGELGEIVVKSPANMRCYLNMPEETAATLKDGWLYTGDLGVLDDEGWVQILDRKKNIIIRGGENISCLEVEGAIHQHPQVLEAGVFSLPHPRLGEEVGAAVHLKPGAGASAEEIRDFLTGRIADFKIPARIWITETPLPQGATDKLDRRVLRARYVTE